MSRGDVTYDRYTSNGSEEWLMRIGPRGGPALLFLPPFFEELNRSRAMLVRTMRALAARGWTCVLPDLPGAGESGRLLEDIGWDDWRSAAFDSASKEVIATVSIRGGCLLDDVLAARGAWRLSPVPGAALLRDLDRTRIAHDGATGGYTPSAALRAGLMAATPIENTQVRTVRLSSARADADHKIDSAPPWRRAEPQSSSELAELLVCDIDTWVRACVAS